MLATRTILQTVAQSMYGSMALKQNKVRHPLMIFVFIFPLDPSARRMAIKNMGAAPMGVR